MRYGGENRTRVRIHITNMKRNQAPKIDWETKPFKPLEYIKISTNLLHDPDVFELTVEQRWLWVALLLHAGRVGVEYELTVSSMRVLFGLRPGWRGVDDLRVLEKQGVITVSIVEKREKSREEKRRERVINTEKTSVLVPAKEVSRFPEFWALYPKKVGKKNSLKKWTSLKLDDKADEILANIKYRLDHDVQWRSGYIKDPSTFLNGAFWEDEMIQTEAAREPTYSESLAAGIVEIEDERRQKGLDPTTGEPIPGGSHVIAN